MRLTAEGLAARRGEDLVFSGVSFSLAAGEALVVTGPNGIGKSTLLRVVAGLLPAEAGSLHLDGGDNEYPGGRIAERTHYLGHRNAMKRELSVRENLVFWQRFMGGSRRVDAPTILEAAEAVGLAAIIHLPFGYLSAGQQRRMAIAKLLVCHRPVWLLDEPTAAMDSASEELFADLVARHRTGGGLVVAATHRPLGLSRATRLDMNQYRPEFPREMA